MIVKMKEEDFEITEDKENKTLTISKKVYPQITCINGKWEDNIESIIKAVEYALGRK